MNEIDRIMTTASAQVVQAELTRQWELLRTDKATRRVVAARGFDLDEIDAIDGMPYEVANPDTDGNRFGAAETILIGIAVGVGTEIGKRIVGELWRRIFKDEIEKTVPTRQP